MIIIIGGGHAGCEAALAAARLGKDVMLFALSLDSIALMPCNPCIGGSAKGHLVREVDALGGEMGKAIDATFIQSKMLNMSKGPAVYSLRAQADKKRYMAYMKQVLESQPNIRLREGEITEIITTAPGGKAKVTAVVTDSNETIPCQAVVICTGTYLNARCLYGETINHNGPNGLRASTKLTASLAKLGFTTQRFKTGTPARIHRRSIDFSKMSPQEGDQNIVPFSFSTPGGGRPRGNVFEALDTSHSQLIAEGDSVIAQSEATITPRGQLQNSFPALPQVPCHLTYTTPTTHEIIKKNITRSAMYSGEIKATGTRYCPSIEDKIIRFADKERHQVFIEPEGLDTAEMYVQGMSSALPADIQEEVYRSVPGLENCEIMRPAYAIEYDAIDATMLTLQLEAKSTDGLFFAGQINGSSGYEEAAAQGLIAGLNAAGANITITRAEGYIGVLIDDLVTKGTTEPYRMMTSRAEYRLLLRQDNADIRLSPKGHAAGLIPQAQYQLFLQKTAAIEAEIARIRKISIGPDAANPLLHKKGSSLLKSGMKLTDLIKRPELSYFDMLEIIPAPELGHLPPFIQEAVKEQVNIQVKYEGYISLQMAQAEAFGKMEAQPIPPGIDYGIIPSLRVEARQKLTALRPENLGQASRITGVSPADLSILMVHLKSTKHTV
ncbi:MAG: tRNA uridine-5-carboxymethylaminomethyl(34) synthesis enzyme MnmG [Defluviitaleaceae bacterium]|nr:tRNA uridine-5-carboxymethylaminomethyl(34) synthesis enzyme MnmG [Defluviitaleaceae bacterium]